MLNNNSYSNISKPLSWMIFKSSRPRREVVKRVADLRSQRPPSPKRASLPKEVARRVAAALRNQSQAPKLTSLPKVDRRMAALRNHRAPSLPNLTKLLDPRNLSNPPSQRLLSPQARLHLKPPKSPLLPSQRHPLLLSPQERLHLKQPQQALLLLRPLLLHLLQLVQ